MLWALSLPLSMIFAGKTYYFILKIYNYVYNCNSKNDNERDREET